MQTNYHVLNGDCLLEQFPTAIAGTKYVARECMVEGPVLGDTLEAVIQTRTNFINLTYGVTPMQYQAQTYKEFNGMIKIPMGSTLYLWFEEDLFCQVNWWFCMFLIQTYTQDLNVHLVKPMAAMRYNFGGMNAAELTTAFNNSVVIEQKDRDLLAQLWRAYQTNKFTNMHAIAFQLQTKYPFVQEAVQAHQQRFDTPTALGKPKRILQEIISELNTQDFGPVFRAFCKRAPYYGFGDAQVMRLLKEL